jgi:predicted AlkP superfamily pyrophosphatase or phosphodiesterase
VIKVSQEAGRHFTYVYWDKVDWVMHEFGVGSIEAAEQIRLVEAGYVKLKAALPTDTIVLMIADHGQLDVCPIDLAKFADLRDLLVREPSVESRAAAFFVKQGKHEAFVQKFNQYFRDYYVLYKTKDVLKLNLFGEGTPHDRSVAFLGDYVAIAIEAYYFLFQANPHMVFKGHHAGLTADEMLVPLIIRT